MYLLLGGGNGVDVTLVDVNSFHYACILSNGVLTGEYDLSRVRMSYDRLQQAFGVRFLQGQALDIDTDTNKVIVDTSSGRKILPFDKVVVAPGVSFVAPPGNYDAKLTPHAWKAGEQTLSLRDQLKNMRRGGVFVLRIPPAPFRCPPGPYERACVLADYLKKNNPYAKVIVLDANSQIIAEPKTFGDAFQNRYGDMLEYRPNVSVFSIDSLKRKLQTSEGELSADVVNFIPDHKAGGFAFRVGLTNDSSGKWATIDPITYESTARNRVHVLGDSQATGQPKSGHMANAQAKVCADNMVRFFSGEPLNTRPATSSACFSPVSRDEAGWLTAVFQYDESTKQMKVVPESFEESKKVSKDNYEEMFSWADNLFADSFG